MIDPDKIAKAQAYIDSLPHPSEAQYSLECDEAQAKRKNCPNCGQFLGLDDQDVPPYCSAGCKEYAENTFYFSTSKKALRFASLVVDLDQKVNITKDGNLFAVFVKGEDDDQ